MTNVVPFTSRASAGGGWTASERERLADLADRLSAGGGKVEAVYGVSDDGDPWCVIKDENEEVLVHIARIDGQFVIHDAAADAIQEGDTLWSACDRLLGPDWREHRGDVVVSLSGRHAQLVVALVMAATFIHEVDHAEAATMPGTPTAPTALGAAAALAPLAAQAQTADDLRHELLGAQDNAEKVTTQPADLEPAPAAPEEPPPLAAVESPALATSLEDPGRLDSPAAPQEDVQVLRGGGGADTLQGGEGRDEIFGGAGDDSLNGGGGADTLHGGEGNDTLQGGGAGPGEFDVLDGGAGDDQIALASDAVATGGAGADTFVFSGQANAEGLLGVVTDFSQGQGDRIAFSGGRTYTVVGEHQEANILGGLNGFFGATATSPLPGLRVDVDLNGDGVADGYLMLGRPGGSAPPEEAKPAEGGWHGELSTSSLYAAPPPPGDFTG
ncbi:calcium-binding protein [Phenylobacterium sp.]|uniref:calcium-binding protein n=1 Tax=Phenylobacterium sp. TaxID=1871053 RepID=UPI002FC5CCAC